MTAFKICKTAPVYDHTDRNNRIFSMMLDGQRLSDIAKAVGLTDSRVRAIVQEMAMEMLRQTRKANPALPMAYSVTSKDFKRDEMLWRLRFEVYKAQHVRPESLRPGQLSC